MRFGNFDAIAFGQRVEAARVLVGCRTRHRFAQRLKRAGAEVTVGELAEIESGGVVPPYPFVAALVAVTGRPQEFFEEALDESTREALT